MCLVLLDIRYRTCLDSRVGLCVTCVIAVATLGSCHDLKSLMDGQERVPWMRRVGIRYAKRAVVKVRTNETLIPKSGEELEMEKVSVSIVHFVPKWTLTWSH